MTVPDQILARRMLANRENGCSISHFYRLNYGRYLISAFIFAALIATTAALELYPLAVFSFGLIVGTIARDLGWFLAIQRTWPFTERVIDWAKVAELAQTETSG